MPLGILDFVTPFTAGANVAARRAQLTLDAQQAEENRIYRAEQQKNAAEAAHDRMLREIQFEEYRNRKAWLDQAEFDYKQQLAQRDDAAAQAAQEAAQQFVQNNYEIGLGMSPDGMDQDRLGKLWKQGLQVGIQMNWNKFSPDSRVKLLQSKMGGGGTEDKGVSANTQLIQENLNKRQQIAIQDRQDREAMRLKENEETRNARKLLHEQGHTDKVIDTLLTYAVKLKEQESLPTMQEAIERAKQDFGIAREAVGKMGIGSGGTHFKRSLDGTLTPQK